MENMDLDLTRSTQNGVKFMELALLLHKRIRGRPFDSWGGGGYGFFVKKKIVQQIFENK